MNARILCFAFFAIAMAIAIFSPSTDAEDGVQFERDIRPILESSCWHCHGEDEQESGLRLDRRGSMLRGGDSGLAAVVPGKPKKSYLLDAVKHLDPQVKMPPDEDPLSKEVVAKLERWIRDGAAWPGQMQEAAVERSNHWAFQPVQRPQVPPSDQLRLGEVDRFLLNQLQQKGLTFSGPAEPRALIRRLSILLTGLIPTPNEVEDYLQAERKDPERAYAALVDRLLASPHFGERWAQHWLDVIRWAETNGSEANLYRKNAWIYRDYVVRSFNEDTPYDQFIREQIAGDSLGMGEATGFLVAGPHVPAATVGREPAAIRQARADRMNEVLQTVGASVMGVTVGCARCHNHKFDPLTIRDYYAMSGVFQDIEFGSRRPEFHDDHPRQQKGRELWKQINQQRNDLRKTGGWEEDWSAYRELHFHPFETTAIRIRFKTPNFGIDELELFGPAAPNRNVALASRGVKVTGFPATGSDGRNPLGRINDGKYGTMAWRANTKGKPDRPWVVFEFPKATMISRIRISSNREYFYDTDYLEKKQYLPKYAYDVDVRGPDGQWKPQVGTWKITTELNKQHPGRSATLQKLHGFIQQLAEEGPRPSFVGRFIEPAPTFVLLRGSPESPRDAVAPSAPTFLDGKLPVDADADGPKRREAFANWLTQPENPLTARVMVNRIWHHLFGRGIVTTTSDFGRAGAEPTHPELLDWLAAEFVSPTGAGAKPWSTKRMIRMLVMTRAFRQSSAPHPVGMKQDANAALLWRFAPKRVEAEVIRDSILLASGSLKDTIGGRSYRIHNVKKTYAQWKVLNNHGPETWRRMIYQERMRRVDDQMFTAFDFPDCGQVRAKRPVSTTPLQALNLMNSPFIIDQSKRLAARAKAESHASRNVNDKQQEMGRSIARLYALLFNRPPSEDEQHACAALAKQHGLDMVCRALLNSNEFAFVP